MEVNRKNLHHHAVPLVLVLAAISFTAVVMLQYNPSDLKSLGKALVSIKQQPAEQLSQLGDAAEAGRAANLSIEFQ